MDVSRSGTDHFIELIRHRGNQYRLLRVMLGAFLVGAFLDLSGMSGLLKYILGLGYLSLGVYLNDVATAVRFGRVELPPYPGVHDIWGVAGRAVALGFPAAALWVAPLLLHPTIALPVAFFAGALSAGLLRYLYGKERGPFGEWGVSCAIIGLLAAGASALIQLSFELASVFALLAVSSAVIVVIAGSLAANGLRD